MTYNVTMQASFEAEKNRKAFLYTFIICGVMLVLAFLITWPILQMAPPVAQDLLEINLGNNEEGMGVEQPLIKGEMAPAQEAAAQAQKATAAKEEPAKDIQPEDNAEADAAPITKPEKPTPKTTNIAKEPTTKPVKTNNPAPVIAVPAPKPQKAKLTYNGPGNGTGNGATEDKGYRYQGNKPGGTGDAGDPTGKPDSYGNTPSGKNGSGLKVKGDRKIINHYIFVGDLPTASVNAVIKVSPEGRGTFIRIDARGSTTTDSRYANDISNKLASIQFDKADHESTVILTFNFTVH
jgi:hypothetical protein